jgi:hypothetical protein
VSELRGADGADEPDDHGDARGPHEPGSGPGDKPGGPTPGAAGSGREAADGPRDHPSAAPRDGYLGYGDAASLARLAFEDQLPPRQESRAASRAGGKHQGTGHDQGDGADTGEGRRTSGTGEGSEAPPNGQADSLAGQSARPDGASAVPDTVPEAGPTELTAALAAVKDMKATFEADLKKLKAGYEALVNESGARTQELKAENRELKAEAKELRAEAKELRAELRAFRESQRAAPDGAEGQAAQSRPLGNATTLDRHDHEETEHQDDKPGLWSNAKYQLYGALGGTMVSAFISEAILDSPAGALFAIVSAAPPVIGALVPVAREGWRKKRDDSPAEP